MKTIYLMRHCKAEGQHAEADLTAEGKRQAEALADSLEDKQISFAVTSPYVRALKTIKPLCDRLDVPYQFDERLKERVLSTEQADDWQQRLKQTFDDPYLKFTGGESSDEAMNRGMEVVKEMIGRPESNIAIVTHGALMSLILRYYDRNFGYDGWKSLSNPDVYELRIDRAGTVTTRIWA